MTYHPPNAAAAANYASRARKRQREGKALTQDQQAFLATYKGKAQPAPRPQAEPARAPAPVQRSVEAPREVERVVQPTSAPEPAPPPQSLRTEEMHVIDFGTPQDSLAKQSQSMCPPGCTHQSHKHKEIPRCAVNGEKQYPPLKDSAAKGTASVAFFAVGCVIAFFKGMDLDNVPDPTPDELSDGADAVKEIVATRAPQLGIYSDLLAGGFSISAYSMRVANMPKEKK